MQLGLEQGTLRLSVYHLLSANTVEVDTGNGALTVVEQGKYRVDTDPNDDSTLVSVNTGSLQITGDDISQTMQAGQAVRLTGHNPIQIDSVPIPPPDSFDRWSEERDQRLSTSNPTGTPPRGNARTTVSGRFANGCSFEANNRQLQNDPETTCENPVPQTSRLLVDVLE